MPTPSGVGFAQDTTRPHEADEAKRATRLTCRRPQASASLKTQVVLAWSMIIDVVLVRYYRYLARRRAVGARGRGRHVATWGTSSSSSSSSAAANPASLRPPPRRLDHAGIRAAAGAADGSACGRCARRRGGADGPAVQRGQRPRRPGDLFHRSGPRSLPCSHRPACATRAEAAGPVLVSRLGRQRRQLRRAPAGSHCQGERLRAGLWRGIPVPTTPTRTTRLHRRRRPVGDAQRHHRRDRHALRRHGQS
jgi:hypothetical protein